MMKNTMTRLLTRVAAVAFFATAFSGMGWAATDSFTATNTDKPTAVNGTTSGTVNGTSSISWSYSVTQNTKSGKSPYVAFGKDSGWQLGSSNSPCTAFSLSTSGITGTITQIQVTSGSASASSRINVTVGGSAFGTQSQATGSGSSVSTSTFTGSASGAIVISATSSSGAFYFKSVTVTYSSATPTVDSDLAITNAPVNLTFDLYNDSAAKSVTYTTSSTGTVTVSGGTGYVTTSLNTATKTITVTPIAVTASAQTITVSQLADDTYRSGSATFTVSVANSTPKVNVTYKANGGTGSDIVVQPDQGSNYTIAGNTFTYAGRFFKKWNTAANGSGQDYAPGDVISGISSDVTLFAQWQAFTYDFTSIAGFSGWDATYSEHTVNYSDASVVFASANKQSNTITDQPVTKGSDVELKMTDGSTIGSVVFVCKQWLDKAQTITLRYSTNSGSSYSAFTPAVTSSNFVLSKDDLPEGTNALTFSFSSSSNQVGITGIFIEKIAGSESSIILSPASVSGATSAALEGSIGIVFNELDIEDESDFDIQFYDSGDADNEIEAPSWVHLTIEPDNEDYKVSYSVEENLGSARAAYFKVYAIGSSADLVYSNLVTISQAAFQMNYAALPFSYDGGKAGIDDVAGFSQSGLGTDYASSPKLKFDGTGDYLLLQLNQAPGTVSFDIKGNSFSGGTFKVQTSANGVDYTDLEEYTSLSDKQSEALDLDYNVRFIKWVYTNKSDGNVALGNISVVAPASAPSTITLAATLADGRYWTTFYNGSAKYSLPSGAQAFKLNSSKQLYLVGDVIPKGNAVVIISNSASVQLTKVDASGSAIEGNILVGADTPTARGAIDGTPYVLGVQGGVLGFHKFTGSGVPAGKAYYIVNE